MSKSKQKVALGAFGALAITVCVAASSWAMGPGGDRGDPQRMLERLNKKLDLTEQQQADVGELLTQSHAGMSEDSQRMKTLRQSMAEQRKNFDAGEAQTMASEIGEITGRMVYTRTSTRAQIYALLSPEQQAEMDEMAEHRKLRKRHKRMHRFGV